MAAPPKKIALLTAFAALYIIWGSTYLGIRFAIELVIRPDDLFTIRETGGAG